MGLFDFVGDMFNSANGAGFKAQGTNITPGTNAAQVQAAYNNALSGVQQQQAFLRALQTQGGIGNQANVFGQQQGLANQLQQQAMGQGPNPALAQLANTTGQNVASQAALMAGQRGVASNPGLMARQIGQQGAQIQQQAGGQAAVLRAQQQLAAQQSLQNQQQMMAGLSTQQVGQQAGALGGYNSAAQGMQQTLLGALGQQNQANVGMQSNINNANAAIATGNQKAEAGMLGGLLNAGGAAAFGMAEGGMVPAYAAGGSVLAQHCNNMKSGGRVPGQAKVSGDSYSNDTVHAKLSPGEVVIPRTATQDPEKLSAFVNHILGFKLSPKGK